MYLLKYTLMNKINLLRRRLLSKNSTVLYCRCCSHAKDHFLHDASVSSTAKSDITKIPLSEAVPWMPRPVYAKTSEACKETSVTTLSNGLKVASESKFGNFCTVGVLIDSGSRYEVAYPSGISHFLEKLAFGATENLTREQIMETFEKQGGICDSQSSRDTLVYAASVESRGLDEAVKVLGEVSLRPLVTAEEVKDAQLAVSFDLESLQLRPEKDTILMDLVHAAAYRDNTVGLPKICPSKNIAKMSRDLLMSYLSQHHIPSRMVLAGVGMEHDRLVEYAQKYFVDTPPIWEKEHDGFTINRNVRIDTSVSQYTGGIVKEEADLSVKLQSNHAAVPELTHLVLGLESCGHQHKDFVSFCVLNMLMGGGGSFSAGGPGKGMYTRLYTNVLNRYHWMHNATAFNHSYIDGGMFCIHASSHPSSMAELAQVLCKEFVAMTTHIGQEELQRAKIQLQSMLLMNLETRPVVFEDIGRQVLATGRRLQPGVFMEQISKIEIDDVIRIASAMLRSHPAVAAFGNLQRLPPMADIEAALLHSEGKLPKRSKFMLFR